MILGKKRIRVKGETKHIVICNRDILDMEERADVLVCSAFKKHYGAYPSTLIGELQRVRKISVEEEACCPEIDRRDEKNYWVSRELSNEIIKRIACIEILDAPANGQKNLNDMSDLRLLSEIFGRLYELLADMVAEGIPVERVALPILGSGNQGIEVCYIIPPLLEQCICALKEISQLKEIVFYERDSAKAKELVAGIKRIDEMEAEAADVFISYCSAQRQVADKIRSRLQRNNISCWMAPYSIPPGSSYQKEIPNALGTIQHVLLILSEEAEQSRWVQKEVGCTIGARHTLIPYQKEFYQHSPHFSFLLDGEQIFEANTSLSEAEQLEELVRYLETKINRNRGTNNSNAPVSHMNKKWDVRQWYKEHWLGVCIVGLEITIVVELLAIIRKLRRL